jgi:hypothetical protein
MDTKHLHYLTANKRNCLTKLQLDNKVMEVGNIRHVCKTFPTRRIKDTAAMKMIAKWFEN